MSHRGDTPAMRALLVFPARAGMSHPHTACAPDLMGFPRTRGDEPVLLGDGVADEEFSPHTRG